MSTTLVTPGRSLARVLFAEDFDDLAGVMVVEARSELEVIAPAHTAADVEDARIRAHAEAFEAAREEARFSRSQAVHAALVAIAAGLDTAAREHAEAATRQAEEIAGLLLDVLMTLLPALCARHGEAEARAVARAVLPALTREPAITVRVSPGIVAGLRGEIEGFDSELAGRIRLLPVDTMVDGDVRISWDQGGAVREVSSVWDAVARALSDAGLVVGASSREDANAG